MDNIIYSKMLVFILILLECVSVLPYKYQKPIAEKVWSVRCKKNSYVLNDCNWCWCGENHRYQCKARVCEEVDAFGHFKDTIREIDVGMEGHGSWRSRPTSCTPGVQYRRASVLCVCDEDGNWPNPVCRDLFRILHSIEVTEKVEESTSQTCAPRKLYLVGCNTCFCPSTGKLDANLCTNRTCADGDPVLDPKPDDAETKNISLQSKSAHIDSIEDRRESKDAEGDPKEVRAESNDDDTDINDAAAELNSPTDSGMIARKDEKELEVYATCNTKNTYTMDSQNCECLTNNRLRCKKNDENTIRRTKQDSGSKTKSSLCKGKIGLVMKKECNLCKCVSGGHMYCTTRKCIATKTGLSLSLKKPPKFRKVEAPIDDLDCIPETSFMRDCNSCYCTKEKGIKKFTCTVKPCRRPLHAIANILIDCVTETTYETGCYFCTCEIIDGRKHKSCRLSRRCWKTLQKKGKLTSLDSLHGSCEPRREYRKGCNTCKCLPDGNMVRCTTHPCISRSTEPLEVEIVPLKQQINEICPKDHSYKVECNLCVCLSNGNALCTTSDCSKQLN